MALTKAGAEVLRSFWRFFMPFLRSFLRANLVLGLGVCLGCGSSEGTGMRNFKEGTGPDVKFGPMKSKDGKVVKNLPDEPPEPEAPPLKK
jgi:hypothetical protein